MIGIALNRGGRDFSERERHLLDLLRPHLIQVYLNAESVTRVNEEQALTGRALDELSYGVVTLIRHGRVQLANKRAVSMLAAYCSGSLQRGSRLPEELERWVRHQVAAAAEAGVLELPRAPLVMGARWPQHHCAIDRRGG